MRIWRLCEEKYAADPLSGEGGLKVDGRWHHTGRPIVYASEHLSLAALEYLTYFTPAQAPDLMQIAIDIPDAAPLARVDTASLSPGWRATPPLQETQDLGTRWLTEAATVGLLVPSRQSENEWNMLLNPRHADFARVTVASVRPYHFDPRLMETLKP